MNEETRQPHVLHISALKLWGMKGNAGMCCLQETLSGQFTAGYRISVIVPAYSLWDNGVTPIIPTSTADYDVYVAPCRWMPMAKRVRSRLDRLKGNILPFVIGWFFGVSRLMLLTLSLFLTARKVKKKHGLKFDMVYAHNQWAAPAGWLLGKHFGVPNISRLYGTFLADLMKKPLVWLRYPIAAAGFLVPHDLLICANDGTRGDEVARKLGIKLDRFRFWQDGVDDHPHAESPSREIFLETAPSCLRKEAFWILSCSRLSYWKRIDRMIHALHHARNQGADCQLVVAGDGQERQPLKELAERLGVADQIGWLGAVPHAEVPKLMDLVDIFMITNDVTNRCNPLFEAMRAGLPVVSIRDTSTADLLKEEENALLANRDDTEALGHHLATICNDRALAARLRDQQKLQADLLWNWEQRMEVEITELQKLIDMNPS